MTVSKFARNITIQCILWSAWLIATLPLSEALNEWDPTGLVQDALQCFVFVSTFVAIGFAAIVPLLWYQQKWKRASVAILMQTIGTLLFLLGSALSPDANLISDADDFYRLAGVLSIVLAGGFLPVTSLVWIQRWRLTRKGQLSTPQPAGILDLITITGFVAAMLAIQRSTGLLSELQDEGPWMAVIIVAFYLLVGAAVSSAILVAIRVLLGPKQDRFNAWSIAGILGTILMSFVACSIAITVDSPPALNPSALVQVTVLSLAAWFSAAITAILICFGLRQHGIQLSSRRIEQK